MEFDWESALVAAGLSKAGDRVELEPMAGGVSSDIILVRSETDCFCVKRALAKLKVAADWRAPVERNRSEVEWLKLAGEIVPGAAPRILADRSGDGWFAMEYLAPAAYPVWKARLRDGHIEPDFAARVGSLIARIHAATTGDAEIARRFATDHIFYPIRLEAYLVAAAGRHADLAGQLLEIARVTQSHKLALVHGDVSPKNILCGPAGPVFLDAECAWYGDPAFDIAFVLNHLLLKCLWRPAHAAAYLACFDALAGAYLGGVAWEPPAVLEARAARLLPGLFLARVDGKSPVEYLTDEGERERVRRVARRLLMRPVESLAEVRAAWAVEMGTR